MLRLSANLGPMADGAGTVSRQPDDALLLIFSSPYTTGEAMFLLFIALSVSFFLSPGTIHCQWVGWIRRAEQQPKYDTVPK
jgi:hypothetical protein